MLCQDIGVVVLLLPFFDLGLDDDDESFDNRIINYICYQFNVMSAC